MARRFGATQHGGSGNGPYNKNDSHTSRFHIENKRTDGKRQITIKATDLADVEQNAAMVGRIPILAFELGGKDFYIVTPLDFHEMAGDG